MIDNPSIHYLVVGLVSVAAILTFTSGMPNDRKRRADDPLSNVLNSRFAVPVDCGRPDANRQPDGLSLAPPREGAPSCGGGITLDEVRQSAKGLPEPWTPHTGFSLSNNTCGIADPESYHYRWQEFIDKARAREILSKTIDMSEQAYSKTADAGDQKRIYVRASGTPANEHHIAACRSYMVRGLIGPPYSCSTVAIFTDGKAYLRRQSADTEACSVSYSSRPSGAIDIRFYLKTQKAPIVIGKSLKNLLRGHLALSVRQREAPSHERSNRSVQLIGTSGIRNSVVLASGWREVIDVRVNVEPRQGDVQVRATVHVMVSRQAVANLNQYIGLSDAQRSEYAKTMDSLISQALRDACAQAHKVDDYIIKCSAG